MRDMHLLYTIIYAGGRGAHDCMCCSSQVLYFNLCCNNEMIYSDIMYRMVRLPCYHIVGRYKSARGHLWSVALLCVAITPYHPAAASSCYRRNNASSICVFLRLRGRLSGSDNALDGCPAGPYCTSGRRRPRANGCPHDRGHDHEQPHTSWSPGAEQRRKEKCPSPFVVHPWLELAS